MVDLCILPTNKLHDLKRPAFSLAALDHNYVDHTHALTCTHTHNSCMTSLEEDSMHTSICVHSVLHDCVCSICAACVSIQCVCVNSVNLS